MRRWWSEASLLDSALAYALRTIPVVPLHHPAVSGSRWRQRWSTIGCSCGQPNCAQPSEHPLTGGGLAEATTDSAQVRAWWERHPEANVGLATGVAFDVLDLDAATAAPRSAGSRPSRPRPGRRQPGHLARPRRLRGRAPEPARQRCPHLLAPRADAAAARGAAAAARAARRPPAARSPRTSRRPRPALRRRAWTRASWDWCWPTSVGRSPKAWGSSSTRPTAWPCSAWPTPARGRSSWPRPTFPRCCCWTPACPAATRSTRWPRSRPPHRRPRCCPVGRRPPEPVRRRHRGRRRRAGGRARVQPAGGGRHPHGGRRRARRGGRGRAAAGRRDPEHGGGPAGVAVVPRA